MHIHAEVPELISQEIRYLVVIGKGTFTVVAADLDERSSQLDNLVLIDPPKNLVQGLIRIRGSLSGQDTRAVKIHYISSF